MKERKRRRRRRKRKSGNKSRKTLTETTTRKREKITSQVKTAITRCLEVVRRGICGAVMVMMVMRGISM